ncbi:MFS transporter [Belnapia sp. T6]|uniref:MFS transporter n=1 Tax=Belnapia mucosa TaxID=2804532 RepID=A0ABS1V2Q2_9PROT|nr:MFS transporter [Belnapia mucosa]MBL6455980.1 MFS transporter [Belnapia mucosa]
MTSTPDPRFVALLLGIGQTLAWGTSYYLPALLAPVVVQDLGADRALVYGAFSLALLISGLVAPRVGRAIERLGGRPVMLASSAVIGIGLALLGLLPGLWGWFAGWVVLGLGMALGLYEAAFATLGQLYGRNARRAITMVTLLGGFASTVGWPATAALLPEVGWRGTCLVYAAVNLLVVLPVYALLPRAATGAAAPGAVADPGEIPLPADWVRRSFLFLAAFFTLRALISTTMSVQLPAMLGGLGLSVGAAVGAAALMGPSQVGGRLLEFTLGKQVHPLRVAWLGGGLLPLGALLLMLVGPVAAVPFVLLYGASNGIITICRGAVPLALFGPRGYPVLMGKLALPVLVSQAAAPILTAPLVAELPAMAVLGLTGLVGLLAMACLVPLRAAPPAPLHRPA